ncbi:hypothetical protein OG539_38765 [Actinacidiphila glaucinigra]|uniref:hypothetical protein n=1 Tax=Actinacidiphila glaucinigra TaxID=235986 RepID=UPI002DD8488B|nr:hypothetical protein [Actinacidiphila glaucinigra]WSD58249.1 hypothetical protein OIE69_04730 [Actinacidiphila glaucinigra]
MLKAIPTTKSGGLLTNAFVAMRRRQTRAAASGTGRHRGRPASEGLTAIDAPGLGTHRRPFDAPVPGGTTSQD